MASDICCFSIIISYNHDLEICWYIIHISFCDIYNLTFVYMVVKSAKNANCRNGDKHFLPLVSNEY